MNRSVYKEKRASISGSARKGIIVTLLVIVMSGGCKKEKEPTEPPANTTPNLQLVADGFVSPLTAMEPPDGSGRLFVVDQVGKIWIVTKDNNKLPEPFIDISGKIVSLNPQYDERGLLGLAFHPDFKSNRQFYVFYTAPPNSGGPEPGELWNNLTRVSEFKAMSGDANKADMGSERIILEADHPQMNHDGGTIAFGPDGYLYISIGDGGGANDVGPGHVTDWYGANQGGNAQNITANLMGKILRINVNSGSPYSIPGDNPFVNTPAAKGEIWAYGLRNPYRFSFDMSGSRELIAGDAGQKLWEEINLVTKGGNYGWNVREGNICFNADSNLLTRDNCPTSDPMGVPLTAPVLQLKNAAHPEGGGMATVIVGGYVYRGNSLPTFQGKYVFGIFSTGENPDAKIYRANPAGQSSWTYEQVTLKDYPNNIGMFLRGFGQDQAGEIYLLTTAGQGVSGTSGKVYKLVAVEE